MTNSKGLVIAGAIGLLLTGFVMGTAVPRQSASSPAEDCPFLNARDAGCPALDDADANRAISYRIAGASDCPALSDSRCPAPAASGCPALGEARPTAGSCPVPPTGRCPALEGGAARATISPAVWIESDEDLLGPRPVADSPPMRSGSRGAVRVLSL